MKIAFVIHKEYKPVLDQVLNDMWPQVIPEFVMYEDYHDTPGMIHGRQHLWDAIMFAGQGPYECCVRHEPQEIPWDYFRGPAESFFKVLLQVSFNRGDITHLSIDSYHKKVVESAYKEIGYKDEDLHYALYPSDHTNPQYFKNVFQFHHDNWRTGKFSYCVTRLTVVAHELRKAGIPFQFGFPTYDVIREQLQTMLKIHLGHKSRDNVFTVFAIELDRTASRETDYASEYTFALEREKILSQVYRYALQINGSVVEPSVREFLVFSEGDNTNMAQGDYHQLELLNNIGSNTLYTAHMGVGRAGSIRQAQIQAEDALRRIHLSDKSRAFCLLEDNRGFEISPSNGEVSRSTVGSALSSAAQKTGVRVQTLYAIYTFTLERGTDEFTAGELSEYLKISVRSTNRLLEKLEAARYVAVTGQSYDNERGRPSRLMKFYPNGHMQ